MADDEQFHPNANVPLWVNIVIPIISEMILVYILISEPMVWYRFFFFHLGLMADEEEYDPDANVPLWVNIVIPIISVVIFVGALVFVYFLPYEIDVERLELWVS